MSKRISILVFLCFVNNYAISAPQNQLRIDPGTISAVGNLLRTLQTDSNVIKLLRNVQSNLLNAAVTGLAMGSLTTEKRMESNLLILLNDFAKTARESKDMSKLADKLKVIDQTMYRDRKSMDILVNAMDLVASGKASRDFRQTMTNLSKDKSEYKAAHLRFTNNKTNNNNVENMINDLHERIKQHLKLMREKVSASRSSAIENLRRNSPAKQQPSKSTSLTFPPAAVNSNGKEKLSLVIGGSTPSSPTFASSAVAANDDNRLNEIFNHNTHQWLPQLYVQMPINYYLPLHETPATFGESFYRFRRQNENENSENGRKKEKQEEAAGEFDDEFETSDGGGGGGILGLIAGLSSSEGVDVGALAGLISTVVTNLFGPGGLDIPSLLGSGSSLLSGLLSGGDNFGKVLASYLGILLEGFANGGGAVSGN